MNFESNLGNERRRICGRVHWDYLFVNWQVFSDAMIITFEFAKRLKTLALIIFKVSGLGLVEIEFGALKAGEPHLTSRYDSFGAKTSSSGAKEACIGGLDWKWSKKRFDRQKVYRQVCSFNYSTPWNCPSGPSSKIRVFLHFRHIRPTVDFKFDHKVGIASSAQNRDLSPEHSSTKFVTKRELLVDRLFNLSTFIDELSSRKGHQIEIYGFEIEIFCSNLKKVI